MIDNQKEVESHQKNLNMMKEEKDHYVQQYNQLARWAGDAQKQLVNRETSIRQLQHEIEKLKKEDRLRPKEENESHNEDYDMLQENLEFVQENYKRSLQEIEGLKRFLEIQRKTETEIKSEISSLNETLKGKNDQIETLSDKNSQLAIDSNQEQTIKQEATTNQVDEIAKFKAEIIQLKKTLIKFKQDLKVKTENIKVMTHQLAEKKEEIADLKHQKTILDGLLKNEKTQVCHSNDQLIVLQQDIESYKGMGLIDASFMTHPHTFFVPQKCR